MPYPPPVPPDPVLTTDPRANGHQPTRAVFIGGGPATATVLLHLAEHARANARRRTAGGATDGGPDPRAAAVGRSVPSEIIILDRDGGPATRATAPPPARDDDETAGRDKTTADDTAAHDKAPTRGKKAASEETATSEETGTRDETAARDDGRTAALLLGDRVSVIDSTGLGFGDWLRANRGRWLTRLIRAGDPRVDRWLCRNRDPLARTEFAGLYLPRTVFDDFLRDRTAQARDALAARGVTVSEQRGEALSVRPYGHDRWRVAIDGRPGPLVAGTVLLAVGGLPRRVPDGIAADPRYFTHADLRRLNATENRLHDLLVRRPAGRRRVVLIGSSAAASEVLFCLEGSLRVAGLIDEFAVVSPSARLADGLTSGLIAPYECPHLSDLLAAAPTTSADLLGAGLRDIALGRRLGYTVVDILPALTPLFTRAFTRLAPAEKQRFVDHDYVAYREATRHITPEYAEAATRLTKQGRLALTRGRMTGLAPQHSGDLAVAVADGGSHFTVSAAAVFDCRGFTGVRDTVNPVVADLVTSGTAWANGSGRGLRVDERFEAAPGLFVLGPTLAGTSHPTAHVWSLETVAPVHALAERVAAHLWRRLRSRGRTLVLSP
jgi:uncharacterized NAD(P)/FAD-binding protein YdhS